MQDIVYVLSLPQDRALRDRVADWVNRGALGPSWVAQRCPDQGEPRGHLSTPLMGAKAMILVLSQDTHKDEAILNAVNHVLTSRKRLVLTASPGPPPELPRVAAAHPVTPLAPNDLRAALSR